MTSVVGSIPIQNFYYLFCYAWDLFPEGKSAPTGFTQSPNIKDLFAQILIRGMRRLIRRGLDRGYYEFSDDLKTIRGRINLNETVRRNLLIKGQVACRFDELDHNVLHNQIIKSTAYELARESKLDERLADQLAELCLEMSDIERIRLSAQSFRRVRVTRNRTQYGLMLRVCELLHHLRLPTQTGSASRFEDILNNHRLMSKVFEHFVRNFYRHEQSKFRVKSEAIEWELTAETEGHEKYLPEMRTDVTLRSKGKTIVIDTKYYHQTLANYRGEKVYSSHLYQLFSYLSNMERLSEVDREAEGILLYPVVGQYLDLRFQGRGHKMRVRTINLDREWHEIHADLLSLIGEQMCLLESG